MPIFVFKVVVSTLLAHGGCIGFYQGNIKLLTDDMQALRPTIFPTVPRLLNKIYDSIMAKAKGPFLLVLSDCILQWSITNSRRTIFPLKKHIQIDSFVFGSIIFYRPHLQSPKWRKICWNSPWNGSRWSWRKASSGIIPFGTRLSSSKFIRNLVEEFGLSFAVRLRSPDG